MRRCSRCGEEKPLDDFHKAKDCRDGRRPECKVCFNAAVAARRLANIDKIRERDRLRYANNPARQEAQKKAAHAHYAANREKHLAQKRSYYKAHRDLFDAWTAKRKAILRGVEHSFYTRREIYDRDGGHCKLCGIALVYEPNGFALDHIVPVSLGGPDTPANIELTCQPCNRKKWATLEGQIHFGV